METRVKSELESRGVSLLLRSSRINVIKQIGAISLAAWILCFGIWGLAYKPSLLLLLLCATFIALFVFVLLAAFILPIDVTADENYLYPKQYFKRYKIPWSEISTVKLYMSGRGTPVMKLTQKDGKTVTQSLAILDDKNTNILLGLFRSHEIPIDKGQSKKSKGQ